MHVVVVAKKSPSRQKKSFLENIIHLLFVSFKWHRDWAPTNSL